MRNPLLLTALARSFLAGKQRVDEVTARGDAMLGHPWRWLRPVARRYVRTFAGRTRPRVRDVIEFLEGDEGFARAVVRHGGKLVIQSLLTEPQQMLPVAATKGWKIPAIESAGELADWLGLAPGELDWLADLKRLGSRPEAGPQLGHYRYRVRTKGHGGLRLIEAPKARLKEVQRRILTEILDRVPPHDAAHGFQHGRSIQSFAAPHAGQRVVLKMDLRDFFPSVSRARIQAFFRTLGYPEAVADLLGGLCTNSTPQSIWRQLPFEVNPDELREARRLYRPPHLAQGAPTSPALANFCFYRADCRLAGLARSAGAEYTRYADDLAFSGDGGFERRVERFSIHVAAILHEEGFAVHHRKTRIMRQGVRQYLAGLVTNEKVNVLRADFDLLKATLINCVRLGPASQNREAHANFRAHLEGRVGFVESINPDKGKRLRAIFDRIQWIGR
jgi:RNA-directed DNA polymerase